MNKTGINDGKLWKNRSKPRTNRMRFSFYTEAKQVKWKVSFLYSSFNIYWKKNAYNSGEKSRAEAKKGNRKRARDKWRERLFAVYTILNAMKRKYSFPIRIIYNIFGVRGHEEKHDRRLVDTFSSSKSLLFDFCWLYAVFFFLLLCATKDMCDLFWWAAIVLLPFVHIFDVRLFLFEEL